MLVDGAKIYPNQPNLCAQAKPNSRQNELIRIVEIEVDDSDDMESMVVVQFYYGV